MSIPFCFNRFSLARARVCVAVTAASSARRTLEAHLVELQEALDLRVDDECNPALNKVHMSHAACLSFLVTCCVHAGIRVAWPPAVGCRQA